MRIRETKAFTAVWIVIAVLVVAWPAAGAAGDEPEHATDIDDATVYPEFPDAPADAPMARLRLVFDLVSGDQVLRAEPNHPFEVYVVAHDVQVALRAWEARLVLDPRLLLLNKDIDAELDLGKGPEVRAALKPRDCKSGTPLVLGHFTLMYTEVGAEDMVLGLAPADPASRPTGAAEGDPPTPVYLVCRPGKDLRPFDACEVCAVVNPATVEPERDAPASPLDAVLRPVKGRSR